MKVRKENWKKEREVYPTYVVKLKAHGRATTISPALPPEYVGKTALVTIIDDDEDIKKMLGEGNE
jgi:putative transposon-encoded protein